MTDKEKRFNGRVKVLKKQLKPLIFIGPHLFFFCVFFIFPFFFGIFISFTKWDLMGTPQFVWFENYADILTKGTLFNREFFNGLLHTGLYTVVMVPLLIAVPMLFAVALNSLNKGKGIFQAILYAPSLLSVATVVLTWRWLLDRELGAVNNIFLIDINWAGSQPYAWISIFMLTLWSGIGGNLVIFFGGIIGNSRNLLRGCRNGRRECLGKVLENYVTRNEFSASLYDCYGNYWWL